MTDQACVIGTKVYPASGGTLTVENIAAGNGRKTDIIKGIIEHMACTADLGTQEKEAGD